MEMLVTTEFDLRPLILSGSCPALRTAWFTSGTSRPKRLFRNYKDTQVGLSHLLVSHCLTSSLSLSVVPLTWACLHRRGDFHGLSSHGKHHRLGYSGERQNYQTVEERLLEQTHAHIHRSST